MAKQNPPTPSPANDPANVPFWRRPGADFVVAPEIEEKKVEKSLIETPDPDESLKLISKVFKDSHLSMVKSFEEQKVSLDQKVAIVIEGMEILANRSHPMWASVDSMTGTTRGIRDIMMEITDVVLGMQFIASSEVLFANLCKIFPHVEDEGISEEK